MENYIDYPGCFADFFRGCFSSLQPYCWPLWFAGSFVWMAGYFLLVKKKVNDVVFFLAVLVGMLLFRLPSFMQYSYNPDESEFLSCINLLSNQLSYWKHADTHTSGPLDSLPFVWFARAGIPMNYFSFRLINAVFIQFPTIIVLYKLFRFLFLPKDSRIILFPFVLFYVFLSTNELIMYTSEQIPNLLLLISIYCVADYCVNSNKIVSLLAAALLVGMLPLAKFQYSILALFMLVVVLFLLFQQKKYALLLVVLFAASLPVLITIGITLHNGSFSDACISYVKMNIVVSGAGLGFGVPFPESLLNGYHLLKANIEFKVLVIGLFILGLVQLFSNPRKLFAYPTELLLLTIFLVVSYFTIIKTGNLFYHYLYILFTGLAAIVAYFYFLNKDSYTYRIFYFLLFVLLFGYSNYQNSYFIDDVFKKSGNLYTPVSVYLNSLQKPDNKMAVWGWNTRLYVETESFQAVRDPNTFNQLFPSDYREYFIQRYIADMERNTPYLFVDAVPGFYFRDETFRHENHPTMKAYIQSHYRFLKEIDQTRIYTRAK